MSERLYMRESNVLRFERIRTSRDIATYPDRIYDLTILLRNLAVAGALTATWRHGLMTGGQSVVDCQHYSCYWHPGCGREVPR